MCRLAGREADIVGLMSVITSDGTVYADPRETLPQMVMKKLDWVREGAGERFSQLEFNMVASLHLTDNRHAAAQAMIERQQWDISPDDVLTMPARLIGTPQEIITQIKCQRDTYGLSYYVVSDSQMESFAPIVSEFTGQSD
jgi:hypothetical protein